MLTLRNSIRVWRSFTFREDLGIDSVLRFLFCECLAAFFVYHTLALQSYTTFLSPSLFGALLALFSLPPSLYAACRLRLAMVLLLGIFGLRLGG